jgi:hypothetical protein
VSDVVTALTISHSRESPSAPSWSDRLPGPTRDSTAALFDRARWGVSAAALPESAGRPRGFCRRRAGCFRNATRDASPYAAA